MLLLHEVLFDSKVNAALLSGSLSQLHTTSVSVGWNVAGRQDVLVAKALPLDVVDLSCIPGSATEVLCHLGQVTSLSHASVSS